MRVTILSLIYCGNWCALLESNAKVERSRINSPFIYAYRYFYCSRSRTYGQHLRRCLNVFLQCPIIVTAGERYWSIWNKSWLWRAHLHHACKLQYSTICAPWENLLTDLAPILIFLNERIKFSVILCSTIFHEFTFCLYILFLFHSLL